MPPPVIRYGLDPTAVNPDNLVMNEKHVLANRRIRAISPVEGAFYGENVIVSEDSSGRILTKGIHYVPQEYYRTPSELYGKAVYGILLVIDPAVTSHITINYQVVGGIYSGTTDTLKHLLEQVRDDGTEFSFYDVVGRPDAYAPTPHFHSLDNGMKFEYIVHALERIRNAILWADSPAYNDIYEYIQNLLREIDARLKHQMDSFITPLLYEFKKNFTKATIGLGHVENLEIATREEGAKAGLPNTRINEFLERKYIALDAIVAFKDKLYEHLVSKEKTNLGRTQAVFLPPKKRSLFEMPNGAVASFVSKREAIVLPDGFDPNIYPEGLNDDTRITIVKVTNNRNNSGGIFLAYFNNGEQAYIGHSATGTIAENIVWKKFLFTEDIKEFTDLLSSHITNTYNPHKTNKAQVGLSEVENLPVITREEILCLKSVRKYMTFDAFLLFMKAFMIGKNGSAADPGDESGEPLDNCQIIYCPCSPCGCGEGGGSTPTPEPCPAYGILKSTFCEGFTKYGIYHNGSCGTYNQLIATNAVDCGYQTPTTNLPPGTELGTFCQGYDLWGKYADGNGGSYNKIIQANSATCGYTTTGVTPTIPGTPTSTGGTPPPNLGYTISISPASLAVGSGAATLTGNISGLTPGRQYTVSHKFRPAHLGTWIPYYNQATFVATGSSHTYSFPVNNYGDIPPGRAEFQGTIEGADSSAGGSRVSNIAQFTYTGEKKITLTLNGTTTGGDIPAGSEVDSRTLFENFPINTNITWKTYLYSNPSTDGPPQMADGTGRAMYDSRAAIVPASHRGQQQWKVVATYAIGAWAGGGTKTVESNVVTINWTGGGGTHPPPGTELGRVCQGTTLVVTLANGSGGSYQQSYANHSSCGGSGGGTCGISREFTTTIHEAVWEVEGERMLIKAGGQFGAPVDGTNNKFTAVSFSRDEFWDTPISAYCSSTTTPLSQIEGLWQNTQWQPHLGQFGGNRPDIDELSRVCAYSIFVRHQHLTPNLQMMDWGTLQVGASGNFYIEFRIKDYGYG